MPDYADPELFEIHSFHFLWSAVPLSLIALLPQKWQLDGRVGVNTIRLLIIIVRRATVECYSLVRAFPVEPSAEEEDFVVAAREQVRHPIVDMLVCIDVFEGLWLRHNKRMTAAKAVNLFILPE